MEFWKQNLSHSFGDVWAFMEGDYFMTAILIFLVCAFLIHFRRGRDSASEWIRDGLEAALATIIVGIIVFFFCLFFVSPAQLFNGKELARQTEHSNYTNQIAVSEILKKQLDDKSPKLDGFINQTMLANELGMTDSLVFLQATIDNSGGSPSYADDFELTVILTNKVSTNAFPIDFSDEYTNRCLRNGQPYLIDLKRYQLLSEKAFKGVSPGEPKRGWIAFRLPGIFYEQFPSTNILLSFSDINGKKTIVTNEFWKGKPAREMRPIDITKTLAGSESIMFPIPITPETNIAGWMPPELPPGCSNVIIFFGASGMIYPRPVAEISPENKGTKFAISDLPDFLLPSINNSWRTKDTWVRWSSMTLSIAGKTIPYPVQPFVVSNRLYVEVQIPFSNEKRRIIMSDAFDPDLPIPDHWNRNYSTNYFSNGIVTGGIYAYEVVNELTNPVLQVFYAAPNEIHVLGIFQVDANSILVSFGDPPALFTFSNSIVQGVDSTQRITTVSLQSQNFRENIRIYTNDTAASLGEIYTNEFYRPIFPGQKAIFKYPANRGNIGVFADWVSDTNKSVTKTLDRMQ